MKYLFCLILLVSQTYASSSFTTRPARLEDLDTVYELICELAVFEGKTRANLPVTKENLYRYGFEQTPYFRVEVAENEQGILGFALYGYSFSAHQGTPFLYLDALYVRPSERGRGIGSALIKQLARYAKEVGCCRMEWHAFGWNNQAISFYEKLGGIVRKDLVLVRIEKGGYTHLAE